MAGSWKNFSTVMNDLNGEIVFTATSAPLAETKLEHVLSMKMFGHTVFSLHR